MARIVTAAAVDWVSLPPFLPRSELVRPFTLYASLFPSCPFLLTKKHFFLTRSAPHAHQEFGSAPEFSPRVWPFLLTRVLLPVSRHAGTAPAPAFAAPPPVPPSAPSVPSTPSRHSRRGQSASLAMPAPASLQSPRTGRPRLPSASSFSASGGGGAMVLSAAVGPASRGVLPLDVGSWVHTTTPQLFRAAVAVVVSNAGTAAPLGVPTLLAFLEPHICCRRPRSGDAGSGSRERSLSGGSGRHCQGSSTAGAGVSEQRAEPGGASEGPPRHRRQQEGWEEGGGAGGDRGWLVAGEMDAAAAAGAAVAEEAGLTGDGLMSRMALEAVGLLVEGLAGQKQPQQQQQQVPLAVLTDMCDNLVRMLHSCLPESFGPAGRVLPGGNGGGGGSKQAGATIIDDNGGADATARSLFAGEADRGGSGDVSLAGEPGNADGAVVAGDPLRSGGGGGGDGGNGRGNSSTSVGAGETAEVDVVRRPNIGKIVDGLWPEVSSGGDDDKSPGSGSERHDVDEGDGGSLVRTAAAAAHSGYDSQRLQEEALSFPTEETPGGGDDRRAAAGGGPPQLARSDSLTLSVDDDDDVHRDHEGAGFDGERVVAMLAAALHLQRILYGLARSHLSGLGEGGTRVLMGGLADGLRYARDFQARHGLRTSLFSAG